MIWGGGKRQTPQHPKSVQFPPGQGLWRECWGSPCSAVEAFVKSARSLGMKFTPLQAFPYLEHPEWTPLSSPEHMAISCWTVTSQIAVTEKERSWGGRGRWWHTTCLLKPPKQKTFLALQTEARANAFSRHSCSWDHLWVCFCALENRLVPLWGRNISSSLMTVSWVPIFSTSYMASFFCL